MHEIVVNLHMHTTYSDGHGSHTDIARAAMKCGLDAVITTDHNVYVSGLEGFYQENKRRVLLLVGEEIHDQTRDPQKSHLLVFGAGRELAGFAPNPQRLIDQARSYNALTFLAHPFEDGLPDFGEGDISWVDWQARGYTGIELWNGLSELKSVIRSKTDALLYAFYPQLVARGPHPGTLLKWDELTSAGRKVVAIGGSDAHALPKRLGPLRRTLFPYEFHFQAINTHLYCPKPLSGDVAADRQMILQAMREGHAFVGYDLPASTREFRFTAQGRDQSAWMGDEICAEGGITLQVHLPARVECSLIKDGKRIKTWHNRDNCTHITTEPGVYRIEAFIHAYGSRRGWIYSNPIYVRK